MFDDFHKLETIEQKLKFLDDKFTPIVFGALVEYKGRYELPGELAKDFNYDEDNEFEIIWSLQEATKWPGIMTYIARVYLYSDLYAVHLHFPGCWPLDEHTSGLSKEDILNSLERLTEKARSQSA